MKIRLIPALGLAFAASSVTLAASFCGYYAIPANRPGAYFTTTNSVLVGNWTLSMQPPGSVAELQRFPVSAAHNATGFSLTLIGGGTTSLTIPVPNPPAPWVVALNLNWAANLAAGSAVGVIDANGMRMLANGPGLHTGTVMLRQDPDATLGFVVAGTSLTTLQVQTFDLPGVGPDVVPLPATSSSATSATLNALVRPWDFESIAWFELGLDEITDRVGQVTVGELECSADLSITLHGLQPNTTYQFRVAGSNETGEARSSPLTFTTARVPVITGIAVPAPDMVRVDFEGSAGAVYEVWGTTNLAGWESLGTGTEVAPGHFRFTEATTAAPTVRFYQISSP
jgi:hypothetical protein